MSQNEERRSKGDRRDSNDKRSENFIKYFIPEKKEKRDGEDRRKSDPDSESKA
jgi:hypothetical protein